MGDLSANFSLSELTHSDRASALGLDNAPPPEIVAHLRLLAENLERVRSLLGHPLLIHSGYRSPALNKAVRGVPTSAHLTGYAADFVCPDFGEPLKIVRSLADPSFNQGLVWDQIIQEGGWVHISFAPSLRREVLTAHFRNGSASYQKGVAAS